MARRYFDIASAVHAIIHSDDKNAFEFLFDHFYVSLIRVATYYLKKEALAEDAVAEVFLKLWESRHKIHKIENLEKYLMVMCKNQCLYTIRSTKKVEYNEELMDFHQQIILDSPESGIISQEFISFFNKTIHELPPKCQVIFLMVKEDGMKYKEVASVLSISIKTVENQMTKAIAHCRKSLRLFQDYHKQIDQSEKK
ncbi:MAG: RNA polymerase sigma-70 factor [Cyclobacteriaceae bacterium]|nr:RNA polymerase sigma-70 factor [Cyclobacteriaceae bacterium]